MKFRLERQGIAFRVANEIPDGSVVNLGIGIPDLVANLIVKDRDIIFQAQVGLLGFGEVVTEPAEIDWDYMDAGGHPVRLKPGASIFDSAGSFAMIRGGRIDIAVLGALQVSERGDLANWWRPDLGVPNIGGAMDVASGAHRVFVGMEHISRDGNLKIVKECSLPLTAARCVDIIFTDIAVIDVTERGLVLREVVPGWTAEEVQELTEPRLIWEQEPRIMEL